jgi:maltodextrin utilization protein YvdJ
LASVRTWAFIVGAVIVAALGNAVSTIWANQENKVSVWLFAMLIISPAVFISFGLTASRTGLAVAAGAVDLSLTLVTIVIGLIGFNEWSKISPVQYLGIGLATAGIALLVFFPKVEAL